MLWKNGGGVREVEKRRENKEEVLYLGKNKM